jgi:hypothetical protein
VPLEARKNRQGSGFRQAFDVKIFQLFFTNESQQAVTSASICSGCGASVFFDVEMINIIV